MAVYMKKRNGEHHFACGAVSGSANDAHLYNEDITVFNPLRVTNGFFCFTLIVKQPGNSKF